jgi:hypothetical protein
LQVSGNFRIYEPGTAPEGLVFPTPIPEVGGKFAPSTGHAILLVGQDVPSVDAYFDATVTAPGGLAVNTSLQLNNMDDLEYLAGKYPKSTLSVGVDLKDSIQEVADGAADAKIDVLLDRLIAYNRPVFLRLGYGFDAASNQYEPAVYVLAWKRFHERMQAKGVALSGEAVSKGGANIALVWESVSCQESSIVAWYPGDALVNWVGTSYCDSGSVEMGIQFAREHFKPVMITASAPTSSEGDWNEWFAPFFQFVNDNNDVVRAVTIDGVEINFQGNEEILRYWKDETKGSLWLRAGPSLFGTLGFTQ